MPTAVKDTQLPKLDRYDSKTDTFDGNIPVSLDVLQELSLTRASFNVRGFLVDDGTTEYIDSVSSTAIVFGTEDCVRITVFAATRDTKAYLNKPSHSNAPVQTDGYFLSVGTLNVEGPRSLGLCHLEHNYVFELTEDERKISNPKVQQKEATRRLACEIVQAVGKFITEKGLNFWQEIARAASEKRGMTFQVIEPSKTT